MVNKYIYYPIWQRILMYMYGREQISTIRVAKDLDFTYSHVLRLLSVLKELGYISILKKGRRNYINVTEEGSELTKLLKKVENIMGEIDNGNTFN